MPSLSEVTQQVYVQVKTEREAKYREAGESAAFDTPQDERDWAADLARRYVAQANQRILGDVGQPLTREQEDLVVTQVLDRVFGLGKLDALLRDDNVADIHVFGADHCMIRMRDGEWVRMPGGVADTDQELIRLIQMAAARHGGNIERIWNSSQPELNMQLRDGSRLFALREVVDRPRLVIRKHNHDLNSLPELIRAGMLNEPAAHLLSAAVKGRLSSVIVGATASGKAHPLDERIPTPEGWTTVGEIRPGDEVIGSDGRPVKVLGLSEVRDETVYTVTFEDGREVRCSADHLWEVSSVSSRRRHAPSKTRTREGRSAEQQRTIERLRAAALEVAPDLYGTFKQAASWAGVSSTQLRSCTPLALGVEHTVETRTRVAEYDGRALWAALTAHAPRTVAGVTLTEGLLAATRPDEGEWLSLHEAARRIFGPDADTADAEFRRLVREVGPDGRSGPAATTTVTLYPVREILHRYAEALDQRQTSEPPLTTVVTTEQMAQEVQVRRRKNWVVEKLPTLDLPDADLPVDPYLLGVWLGDGTTGGGRIYVGDDDIDEARQTGHPSYPHRENLSLRQRPGDAGLVGAKHIPAEYLRASDAQRFALLQGLMDAEGHIDENGCCELTLSDKRLADDVLGLIRSLGIPASRIESDAAYRDEHGDLRFGKPRHRVHFTTSREVFRLGRKRARVSGRPRSQPGLAITCITRHAESVPMRCLYVDAPDHLYLAGDYVPTHNTTLLRSLCAEMPPREFKVTIEDAKEIGLDRDRQRHPLVTAMETKPADLQGKGAITMGALVRMSLRMDPDRVILGEVRPGDDAALQMLNAMTQGQGGSICTMHGESARSAYERLALFVKLSGVDVPDADVARLIAGAVKIVVFLQKEEVEPGSGRYRRVINEIIETRAANGTQVTSNTLMARERGGELYAVTTPSEGIIDDLRAGGFNFDWWRQNAQPPQRGVA